MCIGARASPAAPDDWEQRNSARQATRPRLNSGPAASNVYMHLVCAPVARTLLSNRNYRLLERCVRNNESQMRQGPPSEGRSIKAEEISDAASAQSNSWWCAAGRAAFISHSTTSYITRPRAVHFGEYGYREWPLGELSRHYGSEQHYFIHKFQIRIAFWFVTFIVNKILFWYYKTPSSVSLKDQYIWRYYKHLPSQIYRSFQLKILNTLLF